MSNSLPQPLRAPPPPGGTGNPSKDAMVTQQNGINTQSSLLGSATKGGKRRHNRMKWGGDAIPVGTVTPRYTVTSAGNQTPNNQQMSGLKSINQGQVQAQGDQVPLVTGGKKSRKGRKTKKSRKSRKSRKSKKSRKSRK